MCTTKWCSGECESCQIDKEIEDRYNQETSENNSETDTSKCTYPCCGCPHFMC